MATPPCCPAGSHPALHVPYTPKGNFHRTKKSNIEYYRYCATTPGGRTDENRWKVVFVFTDVFGMHSGRHREVCDLLGDFTGNTCELIMPDLFRGDPIAGEGLDTTLSSDESAKRWWRPADWAVPTLVRMLWRLGTSSYKWRAGSPLRDDIDEVLREVVKKIVDAQQGQGHAAPVEIDVGCLGFCFGAWVVAKFCGDEELLTGFENANLNLRCGLSGHPSWKVESMFHWGSQEALAQSVRCPQLLLNAGNDSWRLKAPDGPAWKELEKNEAAKGSKSIDYDAMKHGWITRGDRHSDKEVVKAQDQAYDDFVAFLEKFLIQPRR